MNEDIFILDDLDRSREAISKILKEIEMEGQPQKKESNDKPKETKIIYTSRTVSLLCAFTENKDLDWPNSEWTITW